MLQGEKIVNIRLSILIAFFRMLFCLLNLSRGASLEIRLQSSIFQGFLNPGTTFKYFRLKLGVS